MGHCGVRYRDPMSAGLANCDKNIVPDAPKRDPRLTAESMGGPDCCANVSSAVATVARIPTAHAMS